tara:strand:- start:30912 stop:34232 length:3321 start_codon:yes stop_codon:yes gene_type:complete
MMWLALLLQQCVIPHSASSADLPDVDQDFVQQKVIPLLESRCYSCHGPEQTRQEEIPGGGLLLTSREAMLQGGDTGPAITPGNPEASLVISAARWDEMEMPPDTKMPKEEVAILEHWIRGGAPWYGPADEALVKREAFPLEARKQAHWCWQPLATTVMPTSADPSWDRNAIDTFISHARDKQNLGHAPDADRQTLVRRLYFAIIGLPPTPDQVDAFVEDPRDDDTAISALALQLLDSPHFGERWGRHWLDLVRYAESRGHEYDHTTPNPWHYRDYVIRALNDDVPFDDFFIEHVAGDLLTQPRTKGNRPANESILGTGFWYLGDWIHSPTDIRADEMDRIDNQIDVFSRSFLGLTIACARCHDHKFDAISTKDYYALAGFLQSSSYRQVRFDTMIENQRIANQIWRDRQSVIETIIGELQKHWPATKQIIEKEIRAGLTAPETSLDPVGWAKIIYDAKNNSNHPLHAIARAAAVAPEKRDAAWEQVLDQAERNWSSAATLEVAFEYTKDEPLRQDGFAFGHAPQRAGQWWIDDQSGTPQLQISTRSKAHHDQRWPALSLTRGTQKDQGFLEKLNRPGRTLKTSTFELDEALHVLVRGTAALQIVVASHRMIQGPLHNDLVQKLDTQGEWKWVTFKTPRYHGERAHVEFVPEPGKPFELEKIVTSDKKPQLSSIGEAIALRVDREGGTDFEQQIDAYITMTLRGLESSLFGESESKTDPLELELANWTLGHPHITEKLIGPVQSMLLDYCGREDQQLEKVQTHSRTALAIWDGDPEDENLLIRGSANNPGPQVPRRNLAALGSQSASENSDGSGRLALAHTLADPKQNPLLSRVMVNRIWHHLFGKGIVKSVDNFGHLGSPPSHPDLLDFLATDFIANDWSIKKLIYKIVTSRTFRQQSQPPGNEVVLRDPENIYLSHMPMRRLEGEIIRDAILTVSGQLDTTLGGRSIPIHLTKFTSGRGRPASGPLDGDGRRSIYLAVRRNFLSPWMLVFDTPIPLGPVGRRNQSNVPAQPLALLNDPFVLEQARLWAEKIVAADGDSPNSTIIGFYRDAFARAPTEQELDVAMNFVNQLAAARGLQNGSWEKDTDLWADYAHVLLNTKEFIFLP